MKGVLPIVGLKDEWNIVLERWFYKGTEFFATECCRSLIIQTMNSVLLNSPSFR